MDQPVFVLSAGRTGTVFLTHTLPSHVPGLHCVHEPPGSRANLVLGNLRAWSGHGGDLLLSRLEAGIRRRRERVPEGVRYVEINPMLCPAADLLPRLGFPLHVVHLVRHPTEWVRSIRAFRASGYRRHLVDFVPFVTPSPWPRPEGWSRLDLVQRAMWRWRVCNEKIEALRGASARYTLLRYEDLFVGDRTTRVRALRLLLEALGRPEPADLSPLLEAPPANPAPPSGPIPVDPADIARICGERMAAYGYPTEPSTR